MRFVVRYKVGSSVREDILEAQSLDEKLPVLSGSFSYGSVSLVVIGMLQEKSDMEIESLILKRRYNMEDKMEIPGEDTRGYRDQVEAEKTWFCDGCCQPKTAAEMSDDSGDEMLCKECWQNYLDRGDMMYEQWREREVE